MTNQYSVGDKVKVVAGTLVFHFFKLGQVVTVTEVSSSAIRCIGTHPTYPDLQVKQYVNFDEIEKVKEDDCDGH